MRFANTTVSSGIPGAFSDRVLSFELPRRRRRLQRAGLSHLAQGRALGDGADRGALHGESTNQVPLLTAGSIADQLIQRVGIAFFGASASALFGNSPEVWVRRFAEEATQAVAD